MKKLEGTIALVAGATRGAGRGIATMLGEAGATVICTGRSVRGHPATKQRPETIEETAELVTAAGGRGVSIRCDHTLPAEVEALAARVKAEFGGLDVLVNDVWGGDALMEMAIPFWQCDLEKGRLLWERAVYSHVVTSRHLVPLMLGRPRGLIVEVTDGDHFAYRGGLFYDLAKMSVIRLAFTQAWDLRRRPIAAVAVTPGFLRSEEMLELFEVTEANWREGAQKDPNFIASETPAYVGRAIAALAADPQVKEKSGRVYSSWGLAKEYGFTDRDGSQPDWGAHFAKAYGRPYRVADAEAFASWVDGPIERCFPDWPIEG
ncbi:MAG: SDR family NAD(P)-dependent oxidoreductase [Deltaproteobacteria bacterium]|nr:SDR family NAD(P)-dependent oxidoreductase [Deltaproteobacteria bacterium]